MICGAFGARCVRIMYGLHACGMPGSVWVSQERWVFLRIEPRASLLLLIWTPHTDALHRWCPTPLVPYTAGARHH